MRAFFFTLTAVLAIPFFPPAAPATAREAIIVPAASTPTQGYWVLSRSRNGSLHMDLEWNDDTQWRRFIDPSELQGLAASQVESASRVPVVFRIARDAGTFEFEGSFRNGKGSGDFKFIVNREFVATLRAVGVRDLESVSDHDLKNIAFGGVSGADIRELQSIGFEPLTLRNVVDLSIRFVTPDYARSMRSLVSDADTMPAIIDLRFNGVPARYARDLHAAGYTSLTRHQLIELWRSGITAEFAREVNGEAGGKATPEELIEMRRHGRN